MSDFSDLLLSFSPSLYWPLDAVNGATDQSGNGRNGTAGGGVTIGGHTATFAPILGADASCTDLDGSDDRIASTYDPYVDGTTRTFMCWLNRDTNSSFDSFLASDGGSNQPRLQGGSGSNNVTFNPGSSGTTITNGIPATGTWYFIALVFNETSNAYEYFLNGSSIQAGSNTSAYGAGSFKVGAESTSTSPFDGKMSHVAVFETGLTADNIADLYEYAISGEPPPVVYSESMASDRRGFAATRKAVA